MPGFTVNGTRDLTCHVTLDHQITAIEKHVFEIRNTRGSRHQILIVGYMTDPSSHISLCKIVKKGMVDHIRVSQSQPFLA